MNYVTPLISTHTPASLNRLFSSFIKHLPFRYAACVPKAMININLK